MNVKPSSFFVRLLLGLAMIAMLSAGFTGKASASGIIYVKSTASGLNNGTSWTNAYKSLQTALGAAVSGNALWVAAGTYKPGSARVSTFTLKDGVAVYGGFAGGETMLSQRNPATQVTVLSGEIGAAGITDNIYHVVTGGGAGGSAVLDGFTVTRGNADGATGGGGMYNLSSSPTLANLIFIDNYGGWGAGMLNKSGSGPALTNVTFDANWGTLGGGIANDSGSSPLLINVTFSGNGAGAGGGMFNNVSSSPVLINVTFAGNSATKGGGIANDSFSNPILTNATFSGNKISGTQGGAIFNDYNSTPSVYDSIFWGDDAPEITNAHVSAATLSDSLLAGACSAGTTCIRVIHTSPVLGPLQNNGGFTKTMALGAGSAAIDRGNKITCGLKDQRGVSRPQGGTCDIGAYEVRAKSFASVATYDGWVLESSENSGLGGTLNSSASTLRVGDDAANRQYRALLSFTTGSLPDGATIVLGKVKVMKQGLAGTNPFTTHGSLWLDLAKPYFGANLTLLASDFQAGASAAPAGKIGSTLSGGWYGGTLNSAGRAAVNKTGTTQLRLRFNLDDNNDSGADYLSLYSGNASTTSYRPLLIVYYNP